MKCHNDTGKCMHRPKCEHACNLRVQPIARPSQADEDAKCRVAYENMFHKIKAPMGFDEWRIAYNAGRRAESTVGFNAGWQSCTGAWAEHMGGMAKAMSIARDDGGHAVLEADEEHEFREWLRGMDSREITARNAWAARALLARMRGEK